MENILLHEIASLQNPKASGSCSQHDHPQKLTWNSIMSVQHVAEPRKCWRGGQPADTSDYGWRKPEDYLSMSKGNPEYVLREVWTFS
jgi:hypothetical protein